MSDKHLSSPNTEKKDLREKLMTCHDSLEDCENRLRKAKNTLRTTAYFEENGKRNVSPQTK